MPACHVLFFSTWLATHIVHGQLQMHLCQDITMAQYSTLPNVHNQQSTVCLKWDMLLSCRIPSGMVIPSHTHRSTHTCVRCCPPVP